MSTRSWYDAPIEERRASSGESPTFRTDDIQDLGRLDPLAIAQVRRDAWPLIRNAEELHDTLLSVGALSELDCDESWQAYFAELEANGRACRREVDGGPMLWISTERWPVVTAR